MDLKMDINGTGDLVFVNGACPVTTLEADVVAQRLAIRLRTIRVEWFLDQTYGVPWFEVLGTKKSAAQIDHIIQREVLDVRGVREITYWRSQVTSDRRYSCTFTVLTSNGSVTDVLNITPPITT